MISVIFACVVKSAEEPTEKSNTQSTDTVKNSSDWYNDLHNPFELTFFDELFALTMPNTYSRQVLFEKC